jgi:hypothetical protein
MTRHGNPPLKWLCARVQHCGRILLHTDVWRFREVLVYNSSLTWHACLGRPLKVCLLDSGQVLEKKVM